MGARPQESEGGSGREEPKWNSCSFEKRGTGDTCIRRLKVRSFVCIMEERSFILAIGMVGEVAALKAGAWGRLRRFRLRTSASNSTPVSCC